MVTFPFSPKEKYVAHFNFMNCVFCHSAGVHTISIDANEGTVAVSSTVDPHLFIAKLAKAGKRAELLWDPIQTPRRNQNPHVEQLLKKPQNENAPSLQSQPAAPAGGSPRAITFDHAQLQDLAKIKGLKHIGLRHSENIKLTFKDHNNDMSHANNNDHAMKINLNGQREVALHNEEQQGYRCHANRCNSLNTKSGNGHVAKNNVTQRCCHGAGDSGFGNGFVEKPMKPMPHYGPPPVPNYVHPFTTPPSYYAHHHHRGIQPRNAPYGDVNCNDDGECAVM